MQTCKHSKCLEMRPHLTLFSIAVNCSFIRARTNLHLHVHLYHSVCSDLDLNSLYSGESGSDPLSPRPDQDVTLHYHIALSLHLSFFVFFVSVCVCTTSEFPNCHVLPGFAKTAVYPSIHSLISDMSKLHNW